MPWTYLADRSSKPDTLCDTIVIVVNSGDAFWGYVILYPLDESLENIVVGIVSERWCAGHGLECSTNSIRSGTQLSSHSGMVVSTLSRGNMHDFNTYSAEEQLLIRTRIEDMTINYNVPMTHSRNHKHTVEVVHF